MQIFSFRIKRLLITALVCSAWVLSVCAQTDTAKEDPFGDWPAEDPSTEDEFTAIEASSAEFGGGDFSAYGYVKSSVRLGSNLFSDDGPQSSGALTTLRLKGDWEPEQLVSAHVELNVETSRGYLNPYGFQEATGLDVVAAAGDGPTPAALQAENPHENFHTELKVDHAWGLFSTGPLDLKIGRMPLAWGTAYAFNPLDRVNSDQDLGGSEGEETPGSTGLMPSLQLGGPLSLTSYLVYEEKTRSAPAGESGEDFDNYPFGLKLQGYHGGTDWSLVFMKEVLYLGDRGSSIDGPTDTYRRWYYLGGEVFTAWADGGLYTEIACRLPGDNGSIDFSDEYGPDELIEAVAGVEYTLEGGTNLRAEYYFHGRGTADSDEYQAAGLLSGELSMLGRDYLFAMVDRTFIDYLDVGLAGLCNLNDGSFALLPEISYALRSNVQLTASGLVPYGRRGSELDGRFELSPGVLPGIDLVEGGMQLEAKISF